jgi:zinc protease
MFLLAAFSIMSSAELITQNASAFADDGKATQIVKSEKTKISHYTLDNGLELVVIPDHRAPVVTHMVWYKVGSADEVAGKSGIAHFLEHLMFKGTSKYKNDEFSSAVVEIGGTENAFTSADYTAYYQRITPDILEPIMGFEADRMENLTLTEETVLPERDVILEERRSRIDTKPSAILGESLSATLYQNHRYGIPVIGWFHEMEQLSKDDAIAFYNKFYTPNNAIVIVAGDVEAQVVKALAEKTYGKVARRAEPGKRQRVKEPRPRTHRSVELYDNKVTTPSWQRMYLVPSYQSGEPLEAEALDILSQILGNGSTSRLYKKLIVENKIAANVGAYYRFQ